MNMGIIRKLKIMHVCSVIETRQSKATMPKDNSSFSQEKKKSCLRWDSNLRHSAY